MKALKTIASETPSVPFRRRLNRGASLCGGDGDSLNESGIVDALETTISGAMEGVTQGIADVFARLQAPEGARGRGEAEGLPPQRPLREEQGAIASISARLQALEGARQEADQTSDPLVAELLCRCRAEHTALRQVAKNGRMSARSSTV